MVSIGYLAAFLGGVLALISPCSALLLPSFFAYAFQRPSALVARTGVFYAGLAVTLVPLGIGSSAASELFYGHRQLLILVAGWTITGLGIMQILGRGFVAGPGAALQRWTARRTMTGRGGMLAVFGLGAAYGLAGFCSGPILGSVLTVAAAQGRPLSGAALLAVYALGMAAPLFVLASLWDRLSLGRRTWLRGRSWRVGPLHVHSTMLVSGILFVAIGVLFLAYDGTAGITGVLGLAGTTRTEFAAQQWVLGLRVPDWAVLSGLAVVIVAAAAWRLRAARPAAPSPASTAAPGPPGRLGGMPDRHGGDPHDPEGFSAHGTENPSGS